MAKARVKRRDTAATPASGRWATAVLPYVILIVCGLLPYLNSFRVPFLYDDIGAILENPSIKKLADLRNVFSPPHATTVAGRPILNLSFAINYAISGLGVWSYHALNLLIHIGSGLVLFTLLKRIFVTAGGRDQIRKQSGILSLLAAAVWMVHPLHTESVTYIVQRAESLVGLLLLLTCYFAVRGFETGRRGWYGVSVLACAIGMATKEVMATAPALVLLLDRAFFSRSFATALRRRTPFYGGLAATWIIVGLLASGGRRGSAGFGEGMSSWEYLRTQFGVVLHYLRLCVCPVPLVFDYGWPVSTSTAAVWVPGMLVLGAIALTAWAVVRNYKLGLVGAWFFIILAPSSTVIPIVTEVAAEHRLYLPLAAVVVLGIVVTARMFEAWGDERRLCWLWGSIVILLGIVTFLRNRDYHTAVLIWKDTVEKRPANALAHYNYARALEEAGRQEEAIDRYVNHALRVRPDYAEARANAGLALARAGRLDQAMQQFDEAIRTHPHLAEAYNNKGLALARQGRTTEALELYRESISRKPTYAEAYYNQGNSLAGSGNAQEALVAYQRAVELKPDFAPAHFNLAFTLEGLGKQEDALNGYEAAIRARPDYGKAYLQLGLLQSRSGNVAAARGNLKMALKFQPDLAAAHQALQQLGMQ